MLITVAGTPITRIAANVSSTTSGSVSNGTTRCARVHQEQHDHEHDHEHFFPHRSQQRVLDASGELRAVVDHAELAARGQRAGVRARSFCLTWAMTARTSAPRLAITIPPTTGVAPSTSAMPLAIAGATRTRRRSR